MPVNSDHQQVRDCRWLWPRDPAPGVELSKTVPVSWANRTPAGSVSIFVGPPEHRGQSGLEDGPGSVAVRAGQSPDGQNRDERAPRLGVALRICITASCQDRGGLCRREVAEPREGREGRRRYQSITDPGSNDAEAEAAGLAGHSADNVPIVMIARTATSHGPFAAPRTTPGLFGDPDWSSTKYPSESPILSKWHVKAFCFAGPRRQWSDGANHIGIGDGVICVLATAYGDITRTKDRQEIKRAGLQVGGRGGSNRDPNRRTCPIERDGNCKLAASPVGDGGIDLGAIGPNHLGPTVHDDLGRVDLPVTSDRGVSLLAGGEG